MARKARRQNPGSKSRLVRGIAAKGLQSLLARDVERKLNKILANTIQEIAIKITNQLVEVGPAWSGEFASSWDVVIEGGSPKSPRVSNGALYNYSKINFPASRFFNALESKKFKFEIVNTSPHAAEAIDQDKAKFSRPNNDPIKKEGQGLELGDDRDNPSFRYEIGGDFSGSLEDAPAARTAEPDWFYIYSIGGALQNDLARGFEIGLKLNYESKS